jgi:8-oxo-dGTP pyrophosphatase MutT (NUDIX family)
MEEKYAGIIFYKFGKGPEFLLINDSYAKKKFWAPPKGKIIGQEDELQCAIREANKITGLITRDFQIEDDFRAEFKYLSETRPKHVVFFLAQLTDPFHKVYPPAEGIHFNWLPLPQAAEKAVFKNMQDVLSQAQDYIEERKSKYNNGNINNYNNNSYQPNYSPNYQKNFDMNNERRFKRPSYDEMGVMRMGSQNRNSFMKSPSPFNQGRQEKNYRTNMMNGGNLNIPFSSNNNGYTGQNNNGPFGPHNPGFGNMRDQYGMQPQQENHLYKTRLCERFEAEGTCPYGSKCHFAHGTSELRRMPQQQSYDDQYNMIQRQQMSQSSNPLYKTRLCERFMNEHYCPYGPKCTFAHGPEELRGRQVDTDDDLNNRMLDMSLKSPGAGPSSPSFNQFRPQQPGYYPHSALHKASYSGMPPNRQQFSSQQPSNVPPLVKPSSPIKSENEMIKESEKKDEYIETNKTETVVEKKKELEKPVIKDFLKSDIEEDKSWMKVVELTNDEKEKLENLKVLEKRPSQPTPKQYLDDPVIISLSEFFREGEHNLKDEVKEITRLEFKHDLSKQQLFNVLIPSLFDESYNVEKLTARKELFLAFIKSANDQIYFLKSWEKYLSCSRMSAVLPRTPILFKDFYDIDLVEEDNILAWYDESPDSSIVKQKCEPFIIW